MEAPTIDALLELKSKEYLKVVRSHEVKGLEHLSNLSGKKGILLCNHGNFSAPIPFMAAFLKSAQDGGLGELRFGPIFHDLSGNLPMTKKLTQNLIGDYKTPKKLEDAIDELNQGTTDVFATAPEGQHCLWKYDEPIAPFEKFGLIVAGIKTQSTFILCVHKGTEAWAKEFPFFPGFQFKQRKGLILSHMALPITFLPVNWFKKQKLDIKIALDEYTPQLSVEKLEAVNDKSERRSLIQAESERIRMKMIEMYKQL